MVSRCPDSLMLAAYVEKALRPEQSAQVAFHLGQCLECARVVQQLLLLAAQEEAVECCQAISVDQKWSGVTEQGAYEEDQELVNGLGHVAPGPMTALERLHASKIIRSRAKSAGMRFPGEGKTSPGSRPSGISGLLAAIGFGAVGGLGLGGNPMGAVVGAHLGAPLSALDSLLGVDKCSADTDHESVATCDALIDHSADSPDYGDRLSTIDDTNLVEYDSEPLAYGGSTGENREALGMNDIYQANPNFGLPASDAVSDDVQQSYSSDCAVRSQELILRDFGFAVSEDGLCQEAMSNGWYDPKSGSSIEDVGKLLENHGISTNRLENANVYTITNELAQGHRVIVAVDANELWHDGLLEDAKDGIGLETPNHALLVSGIDTTDPDNVQVILTDPGTGDVAKEYPIDQFVDSWQDSKCFMVSTAVPAPSTASGMATFDYDLGHIEQIGQHSYDQFCMEHTDSIVDFSGMELYGGEELGISDTTVELPVELDEQSYVDDTLADLDTSVIDEDQGWEHVLDDSEDFSDSNDSASDDLANDDLDSTQQDLNCDL